jgi:hypothetical protein
MNLTYMIAWLTTGAFVSWFAMDAHWRARDAVAVEQGSIVLEGVKYELEREGR